MTEPTFSLSWMRAVPGDLEVAIRPWTGNQQERQMLDLGFSKSGVMAMVSVTALDTFLPLEDFRIRIINPVVEFLSVRLATKQ